MPGPLSDWGPDAATAEPMMPPIRAWLDDEGIPRRQVIRFQVMAPTSAAATTIWPSSPDGVVAIPEAIVFATAVPVSAPMKLAGAGIRIAWLGRSARVDTDVAIALAVSWNPLM